MYEEVYGQYTDTVGHLHWYGTKTGYHTDSENLNRDNFNSNDYCVQNICPKCGRKFTEKMLCKCGQNNASIRL